MASKGFNSGVTGAKSSWVARAIPTGALTETQRKLVLEFRKSKRDLEEAERLIVSLKDKIATLVAEMRDAGMSTINIMRMLRLTKYQYDLLVKSGRALIGDTTNE